MVRSDSTEYKRFIFFASDGSRTLLPGINCFVLTEELGSLCPRKSESRDKTLLAFVKSGHTRIPESIPRWLAKEYSGWWKSIGSNVKILTPFWLSFWSKDSLTNEKFESVSIATRSGFSMPERFSRIFDEETFFHLEEVFPASLVDSLLKQPLARSGS